LGTKDELKTVLNELISEVEKLIKILQNEKYSIKSYQLWYTKSLKIVEFLANDRLSEFTGYYNIDVKRKELTYLNYTIQDFVNGVGARKNSAGKDLWDIKNTTFAKLFNQANILKSLETRIDSMRLPQFTRHMELVKSRCFVNSL
jgi:hypothetical protein